jgi:hypothetical protein
MTSTATSFQQNDASSPKSNKKETLKIQDKCDTNAIKCTVNC